MSVAPRLTDICGHGTEEHSKLPCREAVQWEGKKCLLNRNKNRSGAAVGLGTSEVPQFSPQ